ncbi:universal stress protein family domain-containing protein [Coccidioides immitis RS]|uniref:Universal stress protein family domain-containing protein n=2 Tax=Coccidioides immitis TaxID=5501 RepID=J3KEV0_COCIM|nr:universal stress protein family domain-containing protein [Coccidioides immitis RS]EAS34058.3 universal stress protein family domain-containing protein [Coccidioides immitis RS]
MSQPPHMSLEAALDEERREILDILEGRKHAQQQAPRPGRRASPAPPVRSMLDIAPDPGAQRHGSIAGIGVGVTQPPNRSTAKPGTGVRSMLDPIAPSPLRLTQSATSSPTTDTAPSQETPEGHRRASDASSKGLPEIKKRHGVDPQQDYQFEMLPSIPNYALPKRVTQGGKLGHHNNTTHKNSMAAVMSGADFGPFPGAPRGRQTGRHPSLPGQSRSPSSRLGRSQSPGTRLLNTNSMNLMSTPGKFVTDSGKVINMDHAYRRLSAAALSRSGGSLANYPGKAAPKQADGVDGTAEGDVRLQKDYYSDTLDGGFSEDYTSEEDVGDTSSGEDAWKSEIHRGRRRTRKRADTDGPGQGSSNSGGPRKIRNLLDAAEEERAKVSSSYKVKSLLDPVAPRTTKAASEKPIHKRTGVHPNTSFDITASTGNTPAGSEDEAEFSDIKKAQNLSVYMSPVDQSVPNRVIRTVIRGDFTKLQEEGDRGQRRLRKYLVATDLSEESTYALEWTIGTILRDGDTMYAVYAVEDESGSSKTTGDADSTSSVHINDGAKAMLDITTTVGSQTEKTLGDPNRASAHSSPRGSSSYLIPESKSGSIDSRGTTKNEADRLHAIDLLTQTVVRLLRKTRLQVRVAIEIIHCKSPKHLITEAIDALEPTLVVLGSRGRSALKGVLLGSFSNYIVTKSSVPVMVARKKLRKHAKYKNTHVRFSNNLTAPKKLAFAKVD